MLSFGKRSRAQRLQVVICMSAIIFVVELVVGFLTRSLVLVADAFHVINDLIGFIIILICMKLAEKESKAAKLTNSQQADIPVSNDRQAIAGAKDKQLPQSPKLQTRLSFGWQRAEVVSAFFNGSFLLALGVSIFLQSLDRFVSPEEIQNPLLVVIVGSVALTLNIVSASIFHEHSHDRRDADGNGIPLGQRLGEKHATHHHAAPERRVKKQMNFAVAGILVHLLGDALNTIGVIVVGIITLLVESPKKRFVDPALSMLISLSIIISVISLTRNSAAILLQAAPPNMPSDKILEDMLRVDNVEQVHELHVWQIDQESVFASAHIIIGAAAKDVVEQRFIDEQTLEDVRACLHAWGIHSVTLQAEHCTSTERVARTPAKGAHTEENVILRKNNHVSSAHRGLSCLVQQPLGCDCANDANLLCCSGTFGLI